jgi:glycine/D-amino acid oxidase-like deaminating enzyme
MPTCSLWPYKFVTQLLSKLVDSNAVTLYTHTPVTSISTSSASSTTLHTPHGTLTTKKLIFATNAYTSSICPVYAQRIIPYKGTACHISPSHPISPHLSNTYNIYQPHTSSQPQRTDYLNPSITVQTTAHSCPTCPLTSLLTWPPTFSDGKSLPRG